MTDMIKRVNMAITEYLTTQPGGRPWSTEEISRVALKAIREPAINLYDRIEAVVSELDGVTLSISNGVITIEPDTALKENPAKGESS